MCPGAGELRITTEFGVLAVPPGHIAVVQRGMRFSVALRGGAAARGYVLETYGAHFQLPDLGPIGASRLTPLSRGAPLPLSHERLGDGSGCT